jgi:tetratricopeptide (TPR) repeat protein
LRPSTNAALLVKALNLARQAVELGRGDSDLPWCQLTLGLAEFRNGQYAEAEQTLVVAEHKDIKRDDLKGTAQLFRAMSLFRQHRPEEARKLFSQAEAQMPPLPRIESKPFIDGRAFLIFHGVGAWVGSDDVLIWWMAYKEARSTLNEPPAVTQ